LCFVSIFDSFSVLIHEPDDRFEIFQCHAHFSSVLKTFLCLFVYPNETAVSVYSVQYLSEKHNEAVFRTHTFSMEVACNDFFCAGQLDDESLIAVASQFSIPTVWSEPSRLTHAYEDSSTEGETSSSDDELGETRMVRTKEVPRRPKDKGRKALPRDDECIITSKSRTSAVDRFLAFCLELSDDYSYSTRDQRKMRRRSRKEAGPDDVVVVSVEVSLSCRFGRSHCTRPALS
jgi:hypothetical protein